jgi:outer membrane immunogenic protein
MNKKLLGVAVALALMPGAGQAADIARPVYKAPVAVPVQFSWTGFYIGGHVGALHGRGRFDAVTGPLFPPFGFLAGIPTIVPARIGTVPGASASDTGFIGGGQLGYNWQVGSFVFGFEGDASWAHVRAGTAFAPVDPFGFQTLNGTYTTNIDWTASLRARAGFAWDRLLIYATGGAAFARWDVGSTFTLVNPTPGIIVPVPGASGTTAAGASFTDAGWTIGGGLEWAFANNWSLAGEYRHSRYRGHTITLASTDPSGTLGFPPLTTNVRLTTDQATLRLNYRFGGL